MSTEIITSNTFSGKSTEIDNQSPLYMSTEIITWNTLSSMSIGVYMHITHTYMTELITSKHVLKHVDWSLPASNSYIHVD